MTWVSGKGSLACVVRMKPQACDLMSRLTYCNLSLSQEACQFAAVENKRVHPFNCGCETPFYTILNAARCRSRCIGGLVGSWDSGCLSQDAL